MVISKIIGGLGNQMFQYAAARAVSLRHGVPLLLDISSFANYRLHQGFELKRLFECEAEVASERDLRALLGWQNSNLARKMLGRPLFAPMRSKKWVVEPHFHYWSGLSEVGPESYLSGYWQSEQYFSGVADQIRREFTFREPMNIQNTEIAAKVSAVNAVSLHVRRGDYVNNQQNLATHGVCSIDYYQSAIRYVAERVQSPHFFVFSDDIDWTKENLVLDFPCQYLNHNQGAESYNDMRLMSLCQHHIVANSSFSWWGAWLNPDSDKIVIAPQKWFAAPNKVSDLIPQSWVRI